MFERFTERARRVIILAQEEAKQLNHSAVGTEHILLGIIREGEGVSRKVLESLNINPERVRAEIESAIGHGERTPYAEVAFTSQAKKVLELALAEARRLGHNYIGTEHLLLGLIREGEGVAARVLEAMGTDLERVRSQVVYLLGEGTIKDGIPHVSPQSNETPSTQETPKPEIQSLLAHVTLFSGLNAGELDSLATLIRRHRYAAGEIISRKGDAETALFLIEKGQVKILLASAEGKEVVLSILGPGDFFGDLLAGEPRLADAVAMGNSELLILPRQDFLRFVAEQPQVAINLMVVLSRQLRRFDQLVLNAAIPDVRPLLDRTLLELAQTRGQAGPQGVVIASQTRYGGAEVTRRRDLLGGLVLLVIGVVLLLRNFGYIPPALDQWWPVILILIGGAIVVGPTRRWGRDS